MPASTQAGWILAAAKRDQRTTVWLAVILLFLSGGLLGWNADVIYNAARGPFDFNADLAANPGRRQWVSSSGILIATGLEQQSTLKLFKGVVSSTQVTARYLAQPKLGKALIVKVGTDFSGDPVVGELVPLPAAVLAELSAMGSKDRFHPYLLDATSTYFTIWSLYGLFLLFLALVAFLSLILLGYGLTQLAPEKHDELVALARLGVPATMAAKIEADLARSGPAGISGPFRHSASWLVLSEPFLRIVRAEDLIAFAPSAEAKAVGKEKTVAFAVNLFRKGQDAPIKVDIQTIDFKPVISALRSRYPWAWQEDHAVLAARWTSSRPACEAESATRRADAARAAAVKPPTTAPAT